VTPSQGGLRGTNIVKVEVLPAGTELSTTTQTPITVRTNLAFRVTIEDSGDSQETSIPVTLTITQSRGGNITLKKTIPFINPGQQTAVTFTNIPAVNFGSTAQVKVEVQPVAGESNTGNNSADYPVIFSA
jgi:CARDB